MDRRADAPPASLDADPEAGGPAADHEAVARRILLDQLTGRARSRAELAARLARRNVPEDVADTVLARFEQVGLIDDAAFAREWVHTRHAHRGLARRALSQELRRKGVEADVVAEAVSAVEADDERAAAAELVRRRLPSLARYDDVTVIRRLTGMLARKGYSPGVAQAVVREQVRAAEALLDRVED